MIPFHITIDGRLSYVAFFAHSFDAIDDALDRGARKVVVQPA